MPPIFKALGTIAAWILFVTGCFVILINFIMGIIMGEYLNLAKVPSIQMGLFAGLGLASLVLSVCVMQLRKMLE